MNKEYSLKELLDIKKRFDETFPELDMVSMIRPSETKYFSVYMRQFSMDYLFPKEVHDNVLLNRFCQLFPSVSNFEIWVFNRKEFILQYNPIFVGWRLKDFIKMKNLEFEI